MGSTGALWPLLVVTLVGLLAGLARSGSSQAPSEPTAVIAVSERARPSEVAGLLPGTTTRAQAELLLGDPVGFSHGDARLYRAPSELVGASSLRIQYGDELQVVEKVEVEMQPTLATTTVIPHLGRRVLQKQWADRQLVEYFYPTLMGVVHHTLDAQSPITTIVYLSPRQMADLFADRAEEFLQSQRVADAMADCDKAVIIAPLYARGHFCRGDVASRSGDSSSAVDHFRAAAQASNGAEWRARSLSALAQHFVTIGALDNAWEAFAQARAADLASPDAYLQEARERMSCDQIPQALVLLRTAAERFPNDEQVATQYAELLRQYRQPK